MMVSKRGWFLRVLTWQRRFTLVFIVGGLVAGLGHDVLDRPWFRLPSAPATVSGALGIFALPGGGRSLPVSP
jgi:hypothetical protein